MIYIYAGGHIYIIQLNYIYIKLQRMCDWDFDTMYIDFDPMVIKRGWPKRKI